MPGYANGLGSMASPCVGGRSSNFLTLLILPVIPRLLTANHVGHVLADVEASRANLPISSERPDDPLAENAG